MKRLFLAVLLLCTASFAQAAATVAKFSFGRFGEATIYKPVSVRHVVMFFSAEQGWSAADASLAESLAEQGVLVVGIDLRHYNTQLSKPRDKCSYLAGEFEDFSHELQKHFSPERYHLPVLMGAGQGAVLVYAVAAQGSSGTFVGTLTLGFHPKWRPPLKLCQSYELRYSVDQAGIASLKPSPQLSTPWIAVHASGDTTFSAVELQKFIEVVGTAQSVVVNSDDVRFAQPAAWRTTVVANVAKLAEPDRDPIIFSEELSDLPLEEVRARRVSTRMALFLTGDGGWASIDKGISSELAERGIDVVALSSLQYFWKPRSPEQTANDVARVLRHYLTAWKKRDVMVIGYSFGADIAGFVVNRLSQDLRGKIVSVNLLGLATTADFEVHVTTWLGVDHHGLATQPEVERLPMRVLCVYGEGEKDTVCPSLKNPRASAAKIGDGHHFGDQYRVLAEKIISAASAP